MHAVGAFIASLGLIALATWYRSGRKWYISPGRRWFLSSGDKISPRRDFAIIVILATMIAILTH